MTATTATPAVYNTEAVPLSALFPTSVASLPVSGPAAWWEGDRLRLPDGFTSLVLRAPDGKTVARTASESGRIDLRTLPKGVYLLTLQAPRHTETHKIITY